MEPNIPNPDIMFEALSRDAGLAVVSPLRARGGSVNLRPALLASGGVLVLLAGALVYWSASQDAIPEPSVGSSPDHQRLVALMRSERPFEPRLAGGFDHAPCSVKPRGEDRLLRGPGCGREGFQASTQARLGAEKPGFASTTDPHARGVWSLLWRRNKSDSVAGSIKDLRAAVSAQPAVERWNDLAAALIVEARITQEPALLVEALDWVTRTLEQEPHYLEALYNRALILDDLGLVREARKAWQRYADAETAAPWKQEAENHFAAIREPADTDSLMDRLARGEVAAVAPAVARDSEAVRKLALNRLFAEWSTAVDNGDLADSTTRLDLLRRVGSELRATTGDHLVADAVAAIDRSRQVPTLAKAHANLAKGRRLMEESRYTEAFEQLEDARDRFGRADSPLEGWTDLWLAVCDSSTNRWGDTLERIRIIQSRDDLHRLRVLDARSRWLRGLIELRLGDYESSLTSFVSATQMFEAMGERSLAASVVALSGESYRALGRPREAWRQRIAAFRGLKQSATTAIHNLLLDASIAAREEGFLRASLVLQTFDVSRARKLRSASRLVEALLWRSRASSALGRDSEAGNDLSLAQQKLSDIDDDELRRRMGIQLAEAEAQYLSKSDPEAAVDLYDHVLAFRREMKFQLDSASTLQERAQAKLRLGDIDGAQNDLRHAVWIYERHDLQSLSELYRRDHHQRAQQAFDTLIDLVLSQGEEWEALALAERARLAAVRRIKVADDRLNGDQVDPTSSLVNGETLKEWASQQPSDVVFLVYAVLSDRLVIWKLGNGHMKHWAKPVTRADTWRWIKDLEFGLMSSMDTDNFERHSKGLHSLLLAEPLEDVKKNSRLVIVPDQLLARVPFHALKDPRSERYLIEDHAPSLALSLARSASRSLGDLPQHALVIGDPAVHRHIRLAHARREAREVAALYSASIHLGGEEASREKLLSGLSKIGIFHFAGHGVDDQARPWNSYLAVASNSQKEEARLFARDLIHLELSGLRLAVLAGCSTAKGRTERAVPVSGLTLALLEAGASAVLSTLWAVDDDQVRPLVLSFHHHVANGASPAQSLREAILEKIKNEQSQVKSWASFVLYEQSTTRPE